MYDPRDSVRERQPAPDIALTVRRTAEPPLQAPNAAHCLWGARMRDACPGSVLAAPPIAGERFPSTRWDAVVRRPQDLAALLNQQGLNSGDVQSWCTQDVNPWLQVSDRLLTSPQVPSGVPRAVCTVCIVARCHSGTGVWPEGQKVCWPQRFSAALSQEIALLHRPSRTLVLTDLAFNFKRGGGERPGACTARGITLRRRPAGTPPHCRRRLGGLMHAAPDAPRFPALPAETPLPGGLVGWLLRNTYLSFAGGYRGCCPTTPMGWLVKDAGERSRCCACLLRSGGHLPRLAPLPPLPPQAAHRSSPPPSLAARRRRHGGNGRRHAGPGL